MGNFKNGKKNERKIPNKLYSKEHIDDIALRDGRNREKIYRSLKMAPRNPNSAQSLISVLKLLLKPFLVLRLGHGSWGYHYLQRWCLKQYTVEHDHYDILYRLKKVKGCEKSKSISKRNRSKRIIVFKKRKIIFPII